jgi:hypothetical protein
VAPPVNVIFKLPLPVLERVPIVGACGTVVAVIAEEAEDALPVPIPLVAVTVNVYEVAD